MNSIPPLFINLALMTPLLLAKVGGGCYLIIAPRITLRARWAGVGLVLVAAAQAAHTIARFAMFDHFGPRQPGSAQILGVAAAIGFAEAAALTLLFAAILGPERAAPAGEVE